MEKLDRKKKQNKNKTNNKKTPDKKQNTLSPTFFFCAITACRNRCRVMFSQLESVESVMRKCMNVNMIQ